MLAYERPQVLGSLFTCYKKLSFVPHKVMDEGISGPCGRCALHGNYGSHNSMVPMMKCIHTFNGERRLKYKLTCKDYGIYASCCNYNACQSMTAFSKR